MAIETAVPRSRRALLAASLGGLAALAAQALGRPLPVRAEGETIHVGDEISTATSVTKIMNTVNNDVVLAGRSTGSGDGVYGSSNRGYGVRGHCSSSAGVRGDSDSVGVSGYSGSGYGVEGTSDSSFGVRAYSITYTALRAVSPMRDGIFASTDAAGRSGCYATGSVAGAYGLFGRNTATTAMGYLAGGSVGAAGWSPGQSGVVGSSGAGAPAAPAKTGVYGSAAQDSTAHGVAGQTTAGHGLDGVATSGHGVHGAAGAGVGVYATADPDGRALHAEGRVSFKTAGSATIASGTKSKVVTPGVDLTPASLVLVTLQGNPGATVLHRVAVDVTADTFTVYLTANATAATRFAWFVIG